MWRWMLLLMKPGGVQSQGMVADGDASVEWWEPWVDEGALARGMRSSHIKEKQRWGVGGGGGWGAEQTKTTLLKQQ